MGDDGGRCATKKIYRESKYHVNRLHGMEDQKTLVMVQEQKKVVTILFCVNSKYHEFVSEYFHSGLAQLRGDLLRRARTPMHVFLESYSKLLHLRVSEFQN